MDEALNRGYKEMKEVDLSLVVPNPWNPNEMDEKVFDLLCKKIQENGFLEPIGVVEISDPVYKYRIISGEHRFRACKILNFTKIPAVIYKDFDEDRQKFITLQVQVLQGKLNPTKMSNLLISYANKYEKEVLTELVGFTDKDALDVVYAQVTRDLPEEMKVKMEESKPQIKTIDDLSNVLNSLFNEYGTTVPYHFMFFAYGGKQHVMIQADKKLFDKVKEILKIASQRKEDAGLIFYDLVKDWQGNL